jgi:hypothetical protein
MGLGVRHFINVYEPTQLYGLRDADIKFVGRYYINPNIAEIMRMARAIESEKSNDNRA